MTNRAAFLEELRAIVLDNYTDEQFGVSELVSEYGLSRSQLHRKLKSATGQSVSQFIREIRLDEAAKLLRENDYTASEVAYKVGFNSATYFNTCFNEYFGYPPGEAKHHEATVRSVNTLSQSAPKKNKRVLVWLTVVTLLVATFFVIKYLQKEKDEITSTGVEKPKTIAVLPFKNWSGDSELEYVSDGMTDAVIRRLTAISDIDRVVPFSTIIIYKESNKTTAEIADELNVEYILEGNFKLSGSDVMSNLDLIEVETNDYIWSLEYSGIWDTDDIFGLQAEVAENVAENMSVEVTTKEIAQINFIPTQNEEAYRVFLEGLNQFNKLSTYGFENALVLFDRAIQLDSNYVDAHIHLGRTYTLAGAFWGLIPEKEAWAKAKPYLDRASELDKQQNSQYTEVIERNMATGLFYYELDIPKSERRFLDYSSNSLMTYQAFDFDYARKTGRLDKAMEIVELEIASNPGVSDEYMQRALIHYMKGNTPLALELLSVHDPLYQDNYFYLIETSKWYYYMGEIEKSKNHLDAILDQFDDSPSLLYWLIAIHAELEGNMKDVESSLEILREKYDSKDSGSPAWFIALYYRHIKDFDSMFKWLNLSYERREVEMTWYKEEPMLQPLKNDPRYIELYNKIGFDVVEPLTPAD